VTAMQIPSTQHLLAAWERGRAAPQQVERALALLLAAHANMPRTAAAASLAFSANLPT